MSAPLPRPSASAGTETSGCALSCSKLLGNHQHQLKLAQLMAATLSKHSWWLGVGVIFIAVTATISVAIAVSVATATATAASSSADTFSWLLSVPPDIAVATIVFAAASDTVVAIVAAAVAITTATTATLVSLHWRSCCAALSYFCHASWLLPVALPLLLASLPPVPIVADCSVCCVLLWWCSSQQRCVFPKWRSGRWWHLSPKWCGGRRCRISPWRWG